MNNIEKIRKVKVLGDPIIVGDTAIIQSGDTLGSYIVEKNGVQTSKGAVNLLNDTATIDQSYSEPKTPMGAIEADEQLDEEPKESLELQQPLEDLPGALQPNEPLVGATAKKSYIAPLIAAIVAIILLNN